MDQWIVHVKAGDTRAMILGVTPTRDEQRNPGRVALVSKPVDTTELHLMQPNCSHVSYLCGPAWISLRVSVQVVLSVPIVT